jgi:hypothetical protein
MASPEDRADVAEKALIPRPSAVRDRCRSAATVGVAIAPIANPSITVTVAVSAAAVMAGQGRTTAMVVCC